MSLFLWLKSRGTCQIQTRSVGEWKIVQVTGTFMAGEPEKKFFETVDGLLQSGERKMVIDLTESRFADDTVASAAQVAYHRARSVGADMRFVVLPGRAGGYYHMAGLEMTIPTFSRLGGAIEI
jgi:anti-anti-sigma regulatory factor